MTHLSASPGAPCLDCSMYKLRLKDMSILHMYGSVQERIPFLSCMDQSREGFLSSYVWISPGKDSFLHMYGSVQGTDTVPSIFCNMFDSVQG